MTEKDIYSLWNRACPLSRAFYELAPIEMHERYKDLLNKGSPHARFLKFGPYMENNKGQSLPELIEVFRKDHPVSDTYELSELSERLRQQALSWVRKGELKAYGFAIPRTPDAHPIEVPRDLWDRKVSWEGNYVDGHGLRIESVRLFPAHWLHGKEKRPGRPSRQDEIQRAYIALKKMQAIDFTGPLNAASGKVREHTIALNPNHPDGTKGIGMKAISLAITDDFHAEKESRKKL